MRRKSKSKPDSSEPSTKTDWFDDSPGTQIFVWRVNGRDARDRTLLIGGNKTGFSKLAKQLQQALEAHTKGAKNRTVSISLSQPGKVPPHTVYFAAPPEFADKKEVDIKELEAWLKSNVGGFHGFVFYRQLEIQIEMTSEGIVDCNGQIVRVSIDWKTSRHFVEAFEKNRFPARTFVGLCGATYQSASLNIPVEWLGID